MLLIYVKKQNKTKITLKIFLYYFEDAILRLDNLECVVDDNMKPTEETICSTTACEHNLVL